MKKTTTLLLLLTLVFLMTGSVSAENSRNVRKSNITFTDPYWTIEAAGHFNEIYLTQSLKKMNRARIQYQMIDLGYFDMDYITGERNTPQRGSMNEASLDYLSEYLDLSSIYASDTKNIALFNGAATHISNTELHDAMAEHIVSVATDYEVDGICLDFEPFRNYSDYADFISLIREKAEAVDLCRGEFPVFICGSLTIADDLGANTEKQSAFESLMQQTDFYISMDYDTEKQTARDYINFVAKHVRLNCSLLSGLNVSYIPLGPGAYGGDGYYHNPQVETDIYHAQALQMVMMPPKADFYGSGLWWWKGAIDDGNAYKDFMAYWVNGK